MTDRPASLIPPPTGYADWLAELKARLRSAQQLAALAVNRELVLLYWQIGRDLLERQAREGWGTKVIERLAHDLHTAFPDMKGFSRANLMYMRAFAEAWPDAEIVQQAVGQLEQHITRFLLELGAGFTFVGRQVHPEVGGDDFFVDSLPLGVAEYNLLESLPAELQTGLPSIEQIESELRALDGEAGREAS